MTTKELEEFAKQYVTKFDCYDPNKILYAQVINAFMESVKNRFSDNECAAFSEKKEDSDSVVDDFLQSYMLVNYGLKSGAKRDIMVIIPKFAKEKLSSITNNWQETQVLVNKYWDEFNSGTGSILYDPAVYYALSSFAQHICKNILDRENTIETLKSRIRQCDVDTNLTNMLYKTMEDCCDE